MQDKNLDTFAKKGSQAAHTSGVHVWMYVCVCVCVCARARVGFGCWECVYDGMWARASGVYVWMSVCVRAHARVCVYACVGFSLM